MASISHDLLPGIALRNSYNTKTHTHTELRLRLEDPPINFWMSLTVSMSWWMQFCEQWFHTTKYTMPLNVGACIRTMSIPLGCSEDLENKNRKSNRDHKGLCEHCDVPWLFGFHHASLISGYSNNLMASCQVMCWDVSSYCALKGCLCM